MENEILKLISLYEERVKRWRAITDVSKNAREHNRTSAVLLESVIKDLKDISEKLKYEDKR